MIDFWRLLLITLVAVNPAALRLESEGAANGGRGWAVAAAALPPAVGLVAFAAAIHSEFLDLLDVSAESFDVAAGIVMVVAALRPLLLGRLPEMPVQLGRGPQLLMPVTIVTFALANPAVLAAMVAYSERDGTGITIAAGATAVLLAGAVLSIGARRRRTVAPLTAVVAWTSAVLLVAFGVGLIVDGVRSV